MMKKIADHIFEKIETELFLAESMSYSDELCHEYFNRYTILEKHPDLLKFESDLNIFYNKYFYFVSFSERYQKVYGIDEGLKQQEFKIIEEGERFSQIDWAIIERLDSLVKK